MTRPLRITLVTYSWPPRNAIGVHRPYSWARYWSEAGHQVRVLTAKKYAYDAPLDLALPQLPGVRVEELPYRSALSWAAASIHSSPFGAGLKRLFRRLRSTGAVRQDPRDGWARAAISRAEAWAAGADVAVSTYGPRSAHLIGAALKKANPGLLWVADYRDMWSLDHTQPWGERQRSVETELERATVGAGADILSTVSDELGEQLRALHGRDVVTIYNGFDSDPDDVSSAIAGPRRVCQPPLKIVYTGKIYPGLRDPQPLLAAIRRAESDGRIPPGAVEVHFYGGQMDGVEALGRDAGLEGVVRLHGHVPREVALKAQADADLLLLLESPRPEARGVLTGKIFEYIASGVPVLALGSQSCSAIGRMLAETGTGRAVGDDHEAIIDVLMSRLSGAAAPGFAPNEQAILRYSRRQQAARLLSMIEASLPSNRPGCA